MESGSLGFWGMDFTRFGGVWEWFVFEYLGAKIYFAFSSNFLKKFFYFFLLYYYHSFFILIFLGLVLEVY